MCGKDDCNCDPAGTEKPTVIIRKRETKGDLGNMGNDANAGYAEDDSTTTTRLLDKNWIPAGGRRAGCHVREYASDPQAREEKWRCANGGATVATWC